VTLTEFLTARTCTADGCGQAGKLIRGMTRRGRRAAERMTSVSDDLNQDQRTEPPGRVLHVIAVGDNAAEIEMCALDEARAFFGPELRLYVVPGWQAYATASGFLHGVAESGKRYYASADVRVIEPPPLQT